MMKIPASLISDCQNPFGIRNFDNEHFFARRAGEALQGFNDGKVGHRNASPSCRSSPKTRRFRDDSGLCFGVELLLHARFAAELGG